MESVEEWVKKVKAGEIDEYVHIVKTYQEPIYRYCSRLLGSKHEAEDAVQDILVKAYEKIELYKPTVNFSSWLYKIAYHHCLNLIRKRGNQHKFKWWFKQDTVAESAEQTLTNTMFGEPLASALASLSAEERNLLVLRVFEEKPFAEIGEILGKGAEAAKKKYGRVKLKLKKLMEDREVNETCVNPDKLLKM
ncbi:RNA polymerase sigma factor [Paenibacillus apiarius]|uniref:Sigma-70 family RNA polymerase sigma factor n=1 Tax=Paenibacillus apiarius TaxID=46240 RepID=A0ABT4E1R0_9BACL|nr:sigma-70 family RNA polymerase sigma factor [Paenibacillus apiarius]MCY9516963.1 sigma-70 family RNA polymerase sigma factor [Paenibacillus apiarius]MCY9523549.1 sigma-70 family RNA polymerase sigma factor [Paenibacillus apiarius]MCY9554806.1 sigma-70 family RNA polymerase sigma factor [Paenibacillus apiarius]MCY9561335.1 sigma-70 family RNA polymerase sigma factor [Paenibacillus apiarius]MCY9686948.1 sigma-70 family RNA polymerase sigma factor [Paenibacillus apiarius]